MKRPTIPIISYESQIPVHNYVVFNDYVYNIDALK